MGRRLTTPVGARAVSAKLPPSVQIGLHQLVLNRWRKTGVKPSQNQLFIEAIEHYLEREGVTISQIEEDVRKWRPKGEGLPKVAKFPKRRKGN